MAKDFTLKRYRIMEPFGSYQKGQIVSFHGEHAKQFAKNIKEIVEEKSDKKADKVSTK